MGNCFPPTTTTGYHGEAEDNKGPLQPPPPPANPFREASFQPRSIPSFGPEHQVGRQPSLRTADQEASFQPWSSGIRRQSSREPLVQRQPSSRSTVDVGASSQPRSISGRGSFREPQQVERQPSVQRDRRPLERQPSGAARTAEERQPPMRQPTNAADRRSLLIKKYSFIPDNYTSLQQAPEISRRYSRSSSLDDIDRMSPPSYIDTSMDRRRNQIKKKYSFIPDNYTSIAQVTAALREAGLESSNLIVGIDFTKSNEWTGKRSFNGQSLHKIGDRMNPYEHAISVVGRVLAPFDEDNLIPCFGFGDSLTHDTEVFSFHTDHSPCHGFEEVLACYRKIVPHLRLAGPTSFAPIVETAVDIVERSHGQYHVLLIIADGQVTRSVDTGEGELSPQEKKTIDSIVTASAYPLSIVLVGVGDGPWDDMKKFDDKIPARDFDNFQFVNFTAIMEKQASTAEKEAAFALAALMEVPLQYKATMELGILGRVTGRAKRVVPRPPPLPTDQRLRSMSSRRSQPQEGGGGRSDDPNQVCPVCLTNPKDMAFGCGHMTCRDCSSNLTRCPICRTVITSRLRVYAG